MAAIKPENEAGMTRRKLLSDALDERMRLLHRWHMVTLSSTKVADRHVKKA